MSVTVTYYRMSREQLEQVQNDADAEDAYFYGDDTLPSTCSLYSGAPLSEAIALDIQKEHAALHYLITGTEAEQGDGILFGVVHGGRETSLECSYGYRMCLTTDEIKGIVEALIALPKTTVRARFDARPTSFMYGQNETWDEDDWPMLLRVIEYVREFFSLAASHNEIILISWE